MNEPVSHPSQPATLRGAAQDLVEKIDAMYDSEALYPPGARKDTAVPFMEAEREMKDSRDRLTRLLDSLPDGQGDVRGGERISGYIVCLTEEEIGDWLYPSSNDNPAVQESMVKKFLAAEERTALLLPAPSVSEEPARGKVIPALGERLTALLADAVGAGAKGVADGEDYDVLIAYAVQLGEAARSARFSLPVPSVTEEPARACTCRWTPGGLLNAPDCPVHREPEEARCEAVGTMSNLRCTRPAGHDGDHTDACGKFAKGRDERDR